MILEIGIYQISSICIPVISADQNNLPSNGDVEVIENCNRASVASSSAVTSGNAGDLRRREVVLAKISLYMVFVFLICHSVKIVPNIYEMVQTYLEVRRFSEAIFSHFGLLRI